MIISQTPFRMSFFGGGTDYPDWYLEHGGSVLATTIDKYCHITCRYLPPFFQYRHRLVYSVIELINEFDEIKHPAIRECLRYLPPKGGLEIHHDGDLPARSGLGSSSAFTVGLLNTLKALNGQMISKHELAKLALHIEQNVIKEPVGSQDQISTTYGGLNRIDFNRDGSFNVSPVIMGRERRELLESHLMLFFTGFQRNAWEIAQQKVKNFSRNTSQLKRIHSMVDESQEILLSAQTPIESFGELLHESWLLKRSLASVVSNTDIDQIYEAGLSAGALGGKLLGAGGGGFILFFVKPENQAKVKEKLSKLIHVSFKFDAVGSQIVHYTPQY